MSSHGGNDRRRKGRTQRPTSRTTRQYTTKRLGGRKSRWTAY